MLNQMLVSYVQTVSLHTILRTPWQWPTYRLIFMAARPADQLTSPSQHPNHDLSLQTTLQTNKPRKKKIPRVFSPALWTYQEYVEIKCQLDTTEVFIADLIACSTCFGHQYAHHQELKSIIQWLLPVVFGVVFKLLVWCRAEGYVSGLQDAAASCKPDT